MSLLAAPVIAMLGLLIGLWCPSMPLTTALAVLCGYASGLMIRFDVRATRQDPSADAS